MHAIALSLLLPLAAAEEKGEQSPKIEYRGKQISRERFLRHAKKVSHRELQRNPKLIGFAVEVHGTIDTIGVKHWLFAIQDRKDRVEGTVTVDPTRLRDEGLGASDPAREWSPDCMALFGRIGPWRPCSLICFPGVEWKYALRPIPRGVRGGQIQRYYIDGFVRNTGKQPIAVLRVVARMYQENSLNDELKRFEIEDLKPGETRPLEVEFAVYNFQVLGSTSIPKCELHVVDYEL
ncbi:MAG: FxLYD domain-containing protein [Planctomycetota bacterium]